MDKKKLIGILFLIFLLGLGLRLLNLNKPEGMWNDEYLTWEIAKASFPYEFFQAILRNCHAPLHYIYLKLWILAFSDSDVSLRMSSLVPGVLSIIIMFFVGREAGKKTSDTAGLISAGLCAVSSFLIYFSQEVRIYSLLFLLSALNVLCALKTLENPSKKNCMFFVLTSFLLLLEHTIGFVFVFFSTVSLILFASKKSKFKKFLLTALVVALIIFIPLAGLHIYNVMFNQQYFSQWWAPFSWAKLAFFFTDLFSPYLVNITNAPPSFWSMVYNGHTINWGFTLFAFIPLGIAAFCMVKALFDFDKKIRYILLTSFGVYFTVLIASLFGKILFLTKYMTEIYPLLILLCTAGFVSFKSKGLKITLATVYTVVCIFFIFASQYSPVKLIRTEGQNIPVAMLKVLKYDNDDKVLFLYYPKERFLKYSKEIPENINTSHISKYDFLFIKDNDEIMKDTYAEGKITYKPVFASNVNIGLDKFLKKNVYSDIQKGDRFFLVDFAPVTIFGDTEFQNVLKSEKRYNSTPFLYLVFSYIRNYIVKSANTLLSFSGVVNYQDWRIFIFEKT